MDNKKEIQVVELDWKAPSERKVHDFINQFDDEVKKEFVKNCLEVKEDKLIMKRVDTRNWLSEKFDEKEYILWRNRTVAKAKRLSAIEEMSKWLDL